MIVHDEIFRQCLHELIHRHHFLFDKLRLHSRMSFDLIDTESETTRKRIKKRKVKNINDEMKKIWKFATDNLTRAQINQKKFADHHRKLISIYESRDEAYLSIKNIRIERSSKKLNDKMLNLYSVRKSTQNNVQLELSNFMKIHNTFHISLMRSAAKNLLLKQHSLAARSIIINDEEEYEIDDILDSRRFREKTQYKTSWMNHSLDRKWYDAENFKNAQKMMNEFHRKYSKKSGSYSINQDIMIEHRLRSEARELRKKRKWCENLTCSSI